MARIYRPGQTKPCIIYRFFTSGTVEEVIYQRQMQKGNLVTLTVDSAQPTSTGKKSGFTKEELRDCFTLKEGIDCDTKLKLGNLWPAYGEFESYYN
jgi:SNF2 family DNA or RNA helicase